MNRTWKIVGLAALGAGVVAGTAAAIRRRAGVAPGTPRSVRYWLTRSLAPVLRREPVEFDDTALSELEMARLDLIGALGEHDWPTSVSEGAVTFDQDDQGIFARVIIDKYGNFVTVRPHKEGFQLVSLHPGPEAPGHVAPMDDLALVGVNEINPSFDSLKAALSRMPS